MTDRSTILLVDDDPETLRVLESILETEGSCRVETARSAEGGLARARLLRPDAIISDYRMPGMNGFEFCRQVKADPRLASVMFIVLSGFSDVRLKVEGLDLGVDEYLTKPIDAVELIAKVRAVLRSKQLQDQLRADKVELEELHGRLEESFDQLLSLLLHLLDLSVPGAGRRGQELAAAARKLAGDFEVPEHFVRDLELAAMLQEIGRIVDPRPERTDPGHASAAGDWRYTVASQAVLRQVPPLAGAAALVGAIFENWDGTGHPDRLQRGQIPFRSRLLRVLIDYFGHLHRAEQAGREATPEQALEALDNHRGTWYDPAVLSRLEATLAARPELELRLPKVAVPIGQLTEGMVLAEDLCTGSGVKLLTRGTTLTSGYLDVILHRHQTDPIISRAWIARVSA